MAVRSNFTYVEEKGSSPHVRIIDTTDNRSYHLYGGNAAAFLKNQQHLDIEYDGNKKLVLTDKRTGTEYIAEHHDSSSSEGGDGSGALFAGSLLVGMIAVMDLVPVALTAPAMVLDLLISPIWGSVIGVLMLAYGFWVALTNRKKKSQGITLMALPSTLVAGIISLFVLRYSFQESTLMITGIEPFFTALLGILEIFVVWYFLSLAVMAFASLVTLNFRGFFKISYSYLLFSAILIFVYTLMLGIFRESPTLHVRHTLSALSGFLEMLPGERFYASWLYWLNDHVFSLPVRTIRLYSLIALGVLGVIALIRFVINEVAFKREMERRYEAQKKATPLK